MYRYISNSDETLIKCICHPIYNLLISKLSWANKKTVDVLQAMIESVKIMSINGSMKWMSIKSSCWKQLLSNEKFISFATYLLAHQRKPAACPATRCLPHFLRRQRMPGITLQLWQHAWIGRSDCLKSRLYCRRWQYRGMGILQ